MAKSESAEVATFPGQISGAELDYAITFDEAMAEALAWSDTDTALVGSEYAVVEKEELLGIPFIIRNARFAEGKYTQNGEIRPFLIAHCITKDRAVIITDGSTGVMDQVRVFIDKRAQKGHPSPAQGIVVPNGLTKSEYDYVDPQSVEVSPATTFYIA